MLKNICWVQKLYMLMLGGLFILSTSSMLAGCGNKGDLYLPEKGSLNDKNGQSKVKKKS